jgi:hypothetical protein
MAGFAAAGSANAATDLSISYDATYVGYYSLQGAAGSLGSASGQYAPLTALQATYKGGTALPYANAQSFYTFCVDIGPELIVSGVWQAESLPTGPNGNAIAYISGGIQRAANLYNAYVGQVNIFTPQGELAGAALQMAIWNDLYDGDNTVSGGVFEVHGGNPAPVVALANTFLNSNYNVDNPNLTSTFWEAIDPVANQDLLGPPSFSSNPQVVTIVPEPGIYAAAAGVCAVLGFFVIGRKQKAA